MVVATSIWLLACGRLRFAEVTPAGSSDAPAASADAPACDVAAPFGVPVPIAELDCPGADDGTLRLLPDELSGYFWSARGAIDCSGSAALDHIYLATRATLAEPFTVLAVQGLQPPSPVNELDPTIASDGSLLLFRKSSPGDDIWSAPRTAPAMFTTPAIASALNISTSNVEPFLRLGGNDLYFSAVATGSPDLFRATWTATAFGTPTRIAELSTTCEEGDPVITPDDLTIYFRSDRTATATCADFNIWTATRASAGDAFGSASLVENVNSTGADGPSWVSPDGCRLYISSDRAGTNDIYVSTRGM